MRWYAEHLGRAQEADFWAMCGLLHDIDFEQFPQQHCQKAPQLLAEIVLNSSRNSTAKRLRSYWRKSGRSRSWCTPYAATDTVWYAT